MTTITLYREKECKGSVRFVVPKAQTEIAPISNVYVSRKVAGISEAREITLTLALPAGP